MRLAYDVGAFDGADTAYYLHRGYRVIAIEADPTLAGALRERFSSEIADERCVVLGIGIGPKDEQVPFYVCDQVPLWNSFNPTHGHATRAVPVQCRTFRSILDDHGAPHFLKVDIEGMDHLCVLALTPKDAPSYVSVEAGEQSHRAVLHLQSLGFDKFRLVNQSFWAGTRIPAPGTLAHLAWSARQVARFGLRKVPTAHRVLKTLADARPSTRPTTNGSSWEFSYSSSGPMPDESSDWMDLSEFLYTWESVKRAGLLASTWFDIHAAHQATSKLRG